MSKQTHLAQIHSSSERIYHELNDQQLVTTQGGTYKGAMRLGVQIAKSGRDPHHKLTRSSSAPARLENTSFDNTKTTRSGLHSPGSDFEYGQGSSNIKPTRS
jgi:hypothetical protein